ncbi:MAG TPA: 3-hydroxyacyl-ACP dehydratase FabZ family protein, partial [Opitutales bacterium]|nr:3-hydroxyacyl-ACP dehydratase FabZ family protein [Opitutales bacterium]
MSTFSILLEIVIMEPTQEILNAIPHRPPFLFVDCVLEWSEKGIVAERLVRADEPQFVGHYPGNPIMPGVLLSEAVFQVAAIYLSKRFADAIEGGKTPLLARITEAKFKHIVRPGDTLRIEVQYKEAMSVF